MQSPILEANGAWSCKEPLLQFFQNIADQNPPGRVRLQPTTERPVKNDAVV